MSVQESAVKLPEQLANAAAVPQSADKEDATPASTVSGATSASSAVAAEFEIKCVDFFAESAARDLTDSLKTTGFAVLKTHPVDWSLVEEVYDEWRGFLKTQDAEWDEENEHSKRYLFDSVTQDGYFPRKIAEKAKDSKVKDMKHFFHCYFPWGKYPAECSDKAQRLWQQMSGVGRQLLKWIEEQMDEDVRATLREPLSECVADDRTLLRILHYPAYEFGEEEAGAVRAAAHEDINLITVLPVGSARGLQALDRTTGNWVEVPVDAQSLIINVGDMLQELTGGAYKSTTHRVVKPEGEVAGGDRMATPCFIHAKADTYLSERWTRAHDYLIHRLRANGHIK